VNDTVQSRVNARMLRGFEGFHNELAKLWDQKGVASREKTMQRMVDDKLRNDRLESSRDKRGQRLLEGVADETLDLVSDQLARASVAAMAIRKKASSKIAIESSTATPEPVESRPECIDDSSSTLRSDTSTDTTTTELSTMGM
jgi:hypothetical protein